MTLIDFYYLIAHLIRILNIINGKIVALVCDDKLYVKPTIAGEKFIGKVTEGEPYPGAKPYFLISEWNDSAWLSELIKVSAQELPPPKPKSRRRR